MTTINDTLAEHGTRYGDFTDHALIAQGLQDYMRDVDAGWARLNAVQRQALTVIADKIARILTGDPNYAGNWHDIQGYAKLVEDRLPREVDVASALDSVSVAPPDADDGWIEWHGGARPVPPETRVDLRLRNGELRKGLAGNWTRCWRNDNHKFDIVAYRVVQD